MNLSRSYLRNLFLKYQEFRLKCWGIELVTLSGACTSAGKDISFRAISWSSDCILLFMLQAFSNTLKSFYFHCPEFISISPYSILNGKHPRYSASLFNRMKGHWQWGRSRECPLQSITQLQWIAFLIGAFNF